MNNNFNEEYYPPPPYESKASAPPPPPGMNAQHHHPQMHQPQPMIIYTQPTVTSVQFGPYPMRFTCPNCNAHVMTETHSTPGLLTYVLSGALCILAGYLLCCLVPCCVKECKDIEHRCPNCQHKLGLFKRI